MTSPYLKFIKIKGFGAYSQRTIGPFSPHLNIVYGQNEAGKTTLTSFVGGVLFGWEDARAGKNAYKSANGERAGSLFFAQESEEGADSSELELYRAKNVDGLQGDAFLVADIDKETFKSMFMLNSDELRSLGGKTNMMAKLLTAGSGTYLSPAHALSSVQKGIDEYASRSASIEHSLVNLNAAKEDLKRRMNDAKEQAERFKLQAEELHELVPQRDEMAERLDALNVRIESLSACVHTLEDVEMDEEKALADKEKMLNRQADANRERQSLLRDVDPALVNLSKARQKSLKDQLNVYAAAQAKAEASADAAHAVYENSRMAYEAVSEAGTNEGAAQKREQSRRRQRRIQIVLSVVLPLLFMVAGIPLFMHARDISSLSLTALAGCLVVFAFLLAGAALVMLFRPDTRQNERAEQLEKAQWIMLQDKKKSESCADKLERLKEEERSFLAEAGLADASGSVQVALRMLDGIAVTQSELNVNDQKLQGIAMSLASLDERLKGFEQQRLRALGSVAAPDGDTASRELADRKVQRTKLMEAYEQVNSRYGELKTILDQAGNEHDVDRLKLEYQEVVTRIDDAKTDLVRLLLARRMLEGAVSSWESSAQPEVYRQASRFFSIMTNGSWDRIGVSDEGKLYVENGARDRLFPEFLSLSTCQQLYLSLRFALLLAAPSVGRAVPVLADDILVNFDDKRRASASRVIAEVAQSRQIVLFTCHKEVADVLSDVDDAANIVTL